MSKKRASIVLLSPFFFPEQISTGRYNTFLVRELVRRSKAVEVVAFHPIYPDWRPKRSRATIRDVKIHRGGNSIRYPRSQILRRMILETAFMHHALRNLRHVKEKDIMISIFPPILFSPILSQFVPNTTRKVGIVHDVLGVMAGITTNPQRKIVTVLLRILEKRVFQGCDKLIFLSKGMADKAKKEYDLDPSKVVVRPPFATLEMGHPSDALGHLFTRGYQHIVYSGALGEKQSPMLLLALFQGVIQKQNDVMCHIFSRGPGFDKLTKKTEKEKGRLFFHDLVDEKNLYELYMRSSVQVIPQANGTAEGAIPSKLPNIIKAGVPVFAIGERDSDLDRIIRQSGIGFCANSWDIDELVPQLMDFIHSLDGRTHQERQKTVYNFVKTNFSLENVVREIFE